MATFGYAQAYFDSGSEIAGFNQCSRTFDHLFISGDISDQ